MKTTRALVAPVFTALTLSLGSAAIASDSNETVFGFKWDMAPADVKSMKLGTTNPYEFGFMNPYEGVNERHLGAAMQEAQVEVIATRQWPRKYRGAATHTMVFVRGKLAKIVWHGDKHFFDPDGMKTVAVMNEIIGDLKEKFGSPRQLNGSKATAGKLCVKRPAGECETVAVFGSKDAPVRTFNRRSSHYSEFYIDATRPAWDEALQVMRKVSAEKDAAARKASKSAL